MYKIGVDYRVLDTQYLKSVSTRIQFGILSVCYIEESILHMFTKWMCTDYFVGTFPFFFSIEKATFVLFLRQKLLFYLTTHNEYYRVDNYEAISQYITITYIFYVSFIDQVQEKFLPNFKEPQHLSDLWDGGGGDF